MAGKNIIVCSDGTGNSAIKGRGTNVGESQGERTAAGTAADDDRIPDHLRQWSARASGVSR